MKLFEILRSVHIIRRAVRRGHKKSGLTRAIINRFNRWFKY